VPTIGNKIGECLPQKLGFPSHMNSLFNLFLIEHNSAPKVLIATLICEFDKVITDIELIFIGKYRMIN
jgi:hypothetical protein